MRPHVLHPAHLATAAATVALFACAPSAQAGPGYGLQVGDKAALFKSVDEKMNPVDMAELVKGKPLIVIVGSAS